MAAEVTEADEAAEAAEADEADEAAEADEAEHRPTVRFLSLRETAAAAATSDLRLWGNLGKLRTSL